MLPRIMIILVFGSAFYVPVTKCFMGLNSFKPYNVDIIITFNLQKRKLRFRDVKLP